MSTLWQATWRRWLESRSLRGIDHLSDHLRRDIGIADHDPDLVTGGASREPIRPRIVSGRPTLSVLHVSR